MNKKVLVYCVGIIAFLAMTSFQELPRITVYLIGDSTMADKEKQAYPETGWGMPFACYFDTTAHIENHAKNGRSTRTFITGGLWKPVMDNLKAGDWVLIQFGHNDEVPTKGSYTIEAEFQKNLKLFIDDTRNKKANPVLITPVARRKFDDKGIVTDTHAVYAQLVRKVAMENHIPLIDLSKMSMQVLQRLGPDQSKMLFNHLEPNENPNYPGGRQDDTHFNELGARIMAELVMKGLDSLKLGLADYIRHPANR